MGLAPKIQHSQVYKCYDVVPFCLKSGKAQDEKGQRGGKDGKDKRGRENRRDERGKGGHCRNKVNLVVQQSSDSEISVYHHIIYRCYQELMILGWGTGLSSKP